MANPFRCIAFLLALALASSLAFPSSCISSPKAFPNEEKIYPSDGVISKDGGTAFAWVYLQEGAPRRDHVVFQTNDSRIALLFDTFYSSGKGVEILRLGARAGGNRRAIDSGYDAGNFPEASIIIDNGGTLSDYRHAWYSPVKFPEGEWHSVAMTWEGSPNGKVGIYFDGALAGSKPYSEKYDDGSRLFSAFSVAFRPSGWRGELSAGGMLVPATEMRLSDGGIAISGISFYQCALDDNEILALAGAGKPSSKPQPGASAQPGSPLLPGTASDSNHASGDSPPAPPGGSGDDGVAPGQSGHGSANGAPGQDGYGASGTQESPGSAVQARQRVVSSTEFYAGGKKYFNVTSIRTVRILFGLIPLDVEVSSKVDAETSETVEQTLPWWYFIVAD
ncbi:MAG: LamG-like jellyroll fold domain-containing protein [Candidatus Micrarchaeia archaeon]|jgi:hypothetical protein